MYLGGDQGSEGEKEGSQQGWVHEQAMTVGNWGSVLWGHVGDWEEQPRVSRVPRPRACGNGEGYRDKGRALTVLL